MIKDALQPKDIQRVGIGDSFRPFDGQDIVTSLEKEKKRFFEEGYTHLNSLDVEMPPVEIIGVGMLIPTLKYELPDGLLLELRKSSENMGFEEKIPQYKDFPKLFIDANGTPHDYGDYMLSQGVSEETEDSSFHQDLRLSFFLEVTNQNLDRDAIGRLSLQYKNIQATDDSVVLDCAQRFMQFILWTVDGIEKPHEIVIEGRVIDSLSDLTLNFTLS